MRRLDRGAIDPAPPPEARRAGHYVLHASGNAGAIAINRLLASDLSPVWLPDGSVAVAGSRRAHEQLAAIARELGLRVTSSPGKLAKDLRPIARARVALYRPWLENIDEGWTRWLLEQYEFPFTGVTDADIRRGNLRGRFDVLILPDGSPDRLLSGHPRGAVPDAYAGGLGEQGAAALTAFVREGGTVVALDSSSALVIELLGLPLRDVAQGSGDFFCPGSILGLDLDSSHPLAYGMRPSTTAFFAYGSAWEITTPPSPTDGHAGSSSPSDVDVVGRYPVRDVLKSGWLEGERVIAGKAAVVSARAGLGRAVLIGFRAQHRGQSHATFRLLFNAIHTSGR